MNGGRPYPRRLARAWSALAGLQAGIVAGTAALGWFVAASVLAGRGAWETPLSLASAFYRSSGLPYWSWRSILAGVAAHFVVSGITGACFGLVVSRTRDRRRALLLGVLASILMYYSWHVLLRSPEKLDFFDGDGVLSGHLVFGALLGSLYGAFGRGLMRELQKEEEAGHGGSAGGSGSL
ncbi:MAG: hypothetical protein ACUVXB_13065 [Bryobacteraceae bacterium]